MTRCIRCGRGIGGIPTRTEDRSVLFSLGVLVFIISPTLATSVAIPNKSKFPTAINTTAFHPKVGIEPLNSPRDTQ